MICDFCGESYCISCSKLSTSETRVTQLAKGRILLFACENCVADVKNSFRNQNTNVEDQVRQLKTQVEKSMQSLKEELTTIYNQKISALQENLTGKLEYINNQLNINEKSMPSANENSQFKYHSPVSGLIESKNSPITVEMVKQAMNNALGSVYGSKLGALTDNINRNTTPMEVFTGSGTDESEDFKGEAGKMWIYLGRVTKKSNETSVRNFIKSKIEIPDDELVIMQLQTIGKTNAFRIGISHQYYNALNIPEFWPANIIFRRFHFRRQMSPYQGDMEIEVNQSNNMSNQGKNIFYRATNHNRNLERKNNCRNNNYRSNNYRENDINIPNNRGRNFPRQHLDHSQL